ncbi:MAG TPA: tRNA guanosine(34) transglycosylase Tgt [Sedimentisphaerales bacterium]|jgi:queuine tRNA-ribosyltransferase|nr:tRNA guanosine(34) transglycosylase Tgt [Sedimentisphaerales bacterium]HNU30867.1 tRNA guanosine(34) transglycosylase Tgt [Sedimentisphaerales bacterium]
MACFELLSTDPNCSARRGVLTTAHGQVQTPAFMPVGTVGAVKGMTPDQLEATGAQILLANTYHMLLRPGVEVVEKLGGLHGLMAWNRPILTDSGGYQVFSLNALTKIDDEGVRFASHLDGAPIHLNAEIATQIQFRLGADIIMCFDECTPFPVEEERLRRAVARTLDWAKRCKTAHAELTELDARANPSGSLGPINTTPRAPSLLFGIVQGGIDPQLRRQCAERIVDIGFDGYAIGGLSVGEGHEQMAQTVRHTTPCLPVEAPRYLMGVGMPIDILAAVLAGVDMFDCVLPTRNGRNAFAFTRNGPLRLRNSMHIDSREPLEADCDCYCCRHFSRGALRHYFNSGEMLGPILLSIHNLRFYQRLMADVRGHIEQGDFAAWAAGEMGKYAEIKADQ